MITKPVVIIDNYDSFVYNLAQYVGELGYRPMVFRNDRITLEDILEIDPGHLIISPGPGSPNDGGISNHVIHHFGGKVPVLGVCLGHQCIGQVYGGHIVFASQPVHGKSTLIHHDGRTIYRGLPNPIEGGRYHSLAISTTNFPTVLEVTAVAGEVIMGVRHRHFAIEGVQFHPESIMTPEGHHIVYNFLSNRQGLRQEVNIA